ncbi:uncharacterized protein BJX67DRAFT_341980 [Aspergillus lucknowensis]|uniref:Tyrosyl-DNA phosphodiesterase-domain-containing protein n=1 Tax=Aspergillus lucknowensis TaxID=176173 RepID=A0ABR4M400_9EURO
MDSDSDDEDLRAAIAASLNDVRSTNQNKIDGHGNSIVDLTGDTEGDDDDDMIPVFPKSNSVIGSETSREVSILDDAEDNDEDLRRAIALSLQAVNGQDGPKSKPNSAPSSEQNPVESQAEPKNGGPGFLGLDRKKMEEERLARLAKRKAEESPAVDHREVKQPRIEPQQGPSSEQLRNVSTPSSVPSIQFPDGTVKKTFAFGCHKTTEDIKIEEVLQKSDLELAVLSSFMWDMDWLFSKLDIRSTRFIMVMQAKDDATKRQYESETASMTNIRLCFPPMDGQVNCMHSKLMLLFHPKYLRIVVPTANLVPYDWGESGGVMENNVFLIDLPKKDAETPISDSKTNFYADLVYFLQATTLHDNIIAKLESFDFSNTARFAFVHTIGGSHSGSSWKQTGYCGLGRSLKSLGLKVDKPINLDFVTSSLGSLTPDFMKCIYLAAQGHTLLPQPSPSRSQLTQAYLTGDTGLIELTLRTAKTLPAKHPIDPRRLIHAVTGDEWKDRMRVYFPSQETVLKSKGGPNAAGTICFQSRWFENGKFPAHVLRDCVSVRQGLVMHNKILYVQPDEPIRLPDGSECPGWAYVGSANLSESAWGRLVHDRTTKQPKLNCRNWECGVVVPVIEQKVRPEASVGSAEKGALDKTKTHKGMGGRKIEENAHLLDIFKGTVPVPMRLPGPRYDGSRQPWYFMEMDGT